MRKNIIYVFKGKFNAKMYGMWLRLKYNETNIKIFNVVNRLIGPLVLKKFNNSNSIKKKDLLAITP